MEENTSYVQKPKSLYTHIGYGRVAVKYGKDSTGVKVKYDYILDVYKTLIVRDINEKYNI